MMWIRIEPLDVVLFRDSRPFSAGEQVRAGSSFPPSGLPFVGALRSAILCHNGVGFNKYRDGAWQNIVGTSEDLGPLSFIGPLPVQSDELLLPLPRDLVETDTGGLSHLKPREGRGTIRNLSSSPDLPFDLVNKSPGAKEPDGGYLRGSDLKRYLLNELHNVGKSAQPAAVDEPRLGIGRGDKRIVQKGLIYSVQFKRLVKDTAFLMGLSGEVDSHDLLPSKGMMALGGEARTAAFDIIAPAKLPKPLQDRDMVKELVESLTGKSCFKLYLLTPAIFSRGWIPDGLVEKDVESMQGCRGVGEGETADPDAERRNNVTVEYGGEFVPGLPAKLMAAAVGKRQEIGGWNLAKGAPRPLKRAVPAGSVYFFKTEKPLDNIQAGQLVEGCHFRSIMRPEAGDGISRFCRQAGFGIAVVGAWE